LPAAIYILVQPFEMLARFGVAVHPARTLDGTAAGQRATCFHVGSTFYMIDHCSATTLA
jgi:hypothetical protein